MLKAVEFSCKAWGVGGRCSKWRRSYLVRSAKRGWNRPRPGQHPRDAQDDISSSVSQGGNTSPLRHVQGTRKIRRKEKWDTTGPSLNSHC